MKKKLRPHLQLANTTFSIVGEICLIIMNWSKLELVPSLNYGCWNWSTHSLISHAEKVSKKFSQRIVTVKKIRFCQIMQQKFLYHNAITKFVSNYIFVPSGQAVIEIISDKFLEMQKIAARVIRNACGQASGVKLFIWLQCVPFCEDIKKSKRFLCLQAYQEQRPCIHKNSLKFNSYRHTCAKQRPCIHKKFSKTH